MKLETIDAFLMLQGDISVPIISLQLICVCYGHKLVISFCPRLKKLFLFLSFLVIKRKMRPGWKFALLVLVAGTLCQCKYVLATSCKNPRSVFSFFYLVSRKEEVRLNLPVFCNSQDYKFVGVFVVNE